MYGRRFMDLGLVTIGKADETTLFSSEERRSQAVKSGYVEGVELEKKEVN